MKGLQIFTHSVRQVFGNLDAALRVSGVLYLAQLVLVLVLGLAVITDEAAMQEQVATGTFPWGRLMIVIVLATIASLWIAVGWHRYVLQIERPGIVPVWHGDRILAYFGKSLLLGLILVPVFLVIAVVGGAIVAPLMMNGAGTGTGIILMLILYIPLLVILYRLSVMLPAAALGEQVRTAEAWAATRGDLGAFIGLGVLSLVAGFVIDVPGMWIFAPGSALSMLWQVIAGWVKLMVGISILTTLYGHYVEKRPLV